jgi:Zn-dependent peptidase ImmA (M78 family)
MMLEDHGSPEALADCIADNFRRMRVPVPVDEVAGAVGIEDLREVDSDNFEGLLVTDGGKTKGAIAYSKSSGRERRRFTIAHEIGHFLIPTHGANAQCAKADLGVVKSADSRKSKEAEANRFAANLLMPRKLYLAEIRRLGAPETDHILKLASAFEVSKEAASRRFAELSEYDCAVIFSHQGVVRGFSKSVRFPYLAVKPKDRLPPECASAIAKLKAGETSKWAEADVETWMDRPLRGKTLYEQYLQQANGYGLTMLTLDDAEEDEEEDEEVERAWAPPRFRR